MFGGLLGNHLGPNSDGGFWGVLGGAFAFACARLWLSERQRPNKPDSKWTAQLEMRLPRES
jgi:hypothetical protein